MVGWLQAKPTTRTIKLGGGKKELPRDNRFTGEKQNTHTHKRQSLESNTRVPWGQRERDSERECLGGVAENEIRKSLVGHRLIIFRAGR